MRVTLCVTLLLAALCAVQGRQNTRSVLINHAELPDDEHVLTPVGPRHPSCVHAVAHGATVYSHENGKHLVITENGVTRTVPRCNRTPPHIATRHRRAQRVGAPEVDGNGWQQYVHQNVSGTVTTFNGKWNVPANPTESAQTLFTFTGLQNIDWVPPQPQPSQPFDIIQPVLQYGYSAAGGGDYWTIASWYVTLTTDVVYSPLHKVEAGDEILGIMKRTNDADGWFISAAGKDGISSNITISRPILASQPWIYVTLEVYDVETCAQYPPPGSDTLTYTDLLLEVAGQQQSPVWSVGQDGQQPPICGSTIDIVQPDAITIKF